MADTTAKEAKISIKVMVDKVNKRVVCAEADHSFVDILFSFMALPMGTIVRLLGKLDDKKFEALGSLTNLYQSLKDLPKCYLATEEGKLMLLNPRSLAYDHCRNLKLKIDDTKPIHYVVCMQTYCSSFGRFIRYNNSTSRCLSCRSLLDFKDFHLYYNVSVGDSVFVSDTTTFIVTDDLCVEPYTSARSIQLLTDLGITDMNHLEERNVEMSSYQMLYFLKLALSVDCPLTYFIFSKINPLQDLVGSAKNNTYDYCNLMKNEVSAGANMFLQLSLQKSTGKLLFAEAKEGFIEFLFGMLSLPLGTVIGTLLKGTSSFRCMDNIFESISKMSSNGRLKSHDMKDMLLKPHFGQQQSSSRFLVFPLRGVPILESLNKQTDPRTDVFLKQDGVFLVTDDLTITPSSLFSTLDILKKVKVSPKEIERHQVSIGLKENLDFNIDFTALLAGLKYFESIVKFLLDLDAKPRASTEEVKLDI